MHTYSSAQPRIPKEHVPPMHVWLQRHNQEPRASVWRKMFARATESTDHE